MKTFTVLLLLLSLSVGIALLQSQRPALAAGPIEMGIQTWTLRNLNFDQVVEFAVKHKIRYLQLIANHMDPMAPPEETARKKAILDNNGLTCYTFGVSGTSTDKERNRKLFEFAKTMGISLIIVEPKDQAEWDNLEELVREYDIRLAIHNHGTGTTYGDPEFVKSVLSKRDPRIGVCLDVGWVTAAGFDAEKVFRDYKGRVFDIHLKDKRIEMENGKPVVTDVAIGTGQTNLKGLFRALKETTYDGILALETDQDLKDPTDYVLGALEFVRANQ